MLGKDISPRKTLALFRLTETHIQAEHWAC